jgi:hypothetical protein
MALALHPDKCGAPGAEEAFKSEYTSSTFDGKSLMTVLDSGV